MSVNSDLRDLTIAAHGGLDRWNGYTSLTAHLRNGGLLWGLEGQEGVLADANVHVDQHRQFASHFPMEQGRRTALTPRHVAIETDSGGNVTTRGTPSPGMSSKPPGTSFNWRISPDTRCGRI
jgi:hypothetical protein